MIMIEYTIFIHVNGRLVWSCRLRIVKKKNTPNDNQRYNQNALETGTRNSKTVGLALCRHFSNGQDDVKE
jgi:hypothetical protein